MSVKVNKFHCPQLPNLTIIGIEGSPIDYFAHATQVIGILLNKQSRKSSTLAKNSFFNSQEGKQMRHGGEICAAFQRGPLDAMVYSYRLHSGGRGGPSDFVSLSGIRKILDTLPNQDEDRKLKYRSLFEECLDHVQVGCKLEAATEEHCAEEDDEIMDEAEEIFTESCFYQEMQVSPFMLVVSEKKRLQDQLKFEQERTAVERTRLEHERKMHDLKIQNLRAEWEIERLRIERDDLIAKVARFSEDSHRAHPLRTDINENPPSFSFKLCKLNSAVSHFCKLYSSQWNNNVHGVNYFADLQDDFPGNGNINEVNQGSGIDQEGFDPGSSVVVRMAETVSGVVFGPGPDGKHHCFAFRYKGNRITKQALDNAKIALKEAYGVESNGMQYLCVVLYKSHGRRMSTVATVPYLLLSNSIILEPIETSDGRLHHITVFKTQVVTNDPLLAKLKEPCNHKWKWHNANVNPVQTTVH